MEIQLTLEEEDFNLWGTKETFEVDFVEISGEDYIHSLTHKGSDLSPLIDKHRDYIWSAIREREIALKQARIEEIAEQQFELERGN
tara:strand:- start:1819 stop:2076 length:258 start_codon:yes stop_codon:yes gene_type:complete